MTTSRRRIVYVVFLVGTGIVLGCTVGLIAGLLHDLPQVRSLESFKPDAVTRIFSADKVLLAELFIEKRVPVPLHVIPEDLKDAIVATEDRQFFEHAGVDLRGILRALITDIKAGRFVEGASTITQQLSRTLFLTPEKSIMRKLKEAFLSFQIERRYTKNEILELYLNQIYFGSGAYGVEAAARTFFGKPVSDLTLAECALVAGMPKAPSRYSPLVDPSLALKRRNIVLKQMAVNGVISHDQLAEARSSPLTLSKSRNISMKAPYFVTHVRNRLEKVLGETALYRTGLTVHTTLNCGMQQIAEEAVEKGLRDLSVRMQAGGTAAGESPQAALVCLDNRQGAILTMVGGKDFQESRFNRATMARRQPGSAFKPLVYACAVEKGFSQNDLLWDAPVVFKGVKDGTEWRPRNFSRSFKGEMTLRHALAVSQNIPAVRLLDKVGPTTAVHWAHRMGIASPLAPNLSLVLGTSEVTLLELTAAYATFPNGGVKTEPFAILEVLDRAGRSVWRARPRRHAVLSAETAAIVTDMLHAVVTSGTGRAARRIPHALAGKTGTTDTCRDALFVGFSPTVACGVWVGLDSYGTLGTRETGAKAALPIWTAFMEKALAARPYRDFPLPEGVVRIRIDSESGLLASEECPNSVMMVLKKGTEPKQYCKHGPGNG